MKKDFFILKETLKSIPAALIFATSWHLSSLERIDSLPSFWNADKLVHTICFSGLSFWVAFALGTNSKKGIFLPAAVVSFYGIIDEIHQSFTPGRESSFFDWIFDTTGGFLGAAAFVFLLPRILNFLKLRLNFV